MDIKELFSSFSEKDYYKTVNLHIHSNNSDGIEDFDKLISDAKKLNMKYISITDHNSIEGYKTTKYLDDSILIKGIEFDCMYNLVVMHILGYGVDINNPELNKLCSNDKNDFIRLFKSRHPKRVIEAIHASGGIAVLAHPCCSNAINLKHLIKTLVGFGLDGLEVYYPYDRFRAVVKFSSRELPKKIADELGLIKTGGSDLHGKLL